MGFEDLLPAGVVLVEGDLDDPRWVAVSEEDALVEHATPERAREFLAGRGCARVGLRAIGHVDAPLLIGPDRAPVWPSGATGSISHAMGRVVAAVAPTTAYAGIGVDLERCGPLAESLTDLVLPVPSERHLLEAFGSDATVLALSAKESVYKACGAVTGWLEHADVVLVAASLDSFRAWVPRAGVEVDGSWECDTSAVRTVVARPVGPLVVLD